MRFLYVASLPVTIPVALVGLFQIPVVPALVVALGLFWFELGRIGQRR